MKPFMKKFALFIIFMGCVTDVFADERLYIDEQEFDTSHHSFHIHMGHNRWMRTNSVHSDASGLYTFESEIHQQFDKDLNKLVSATDWKCPYCFHWWPDNTSCQNARCPSKFK